MSEQSQAPVTEQSSTVEAPDWNLLNDLSNNQDVAIETQKVETPEQKVNTDVVEESKVTTESEIKVEDPEKKEEKVEEKKEEAAKEIVKPDFEIKLDDLKDIPKTFEDGDWRGVAKDLGFELEEDSFEKFKDSIVHKSELEKVSKQTRQQIFAELKPTTAAALEMLELGMPEELILEPTKEIDNALSVIEQHLKLDDAELYRKVLENTEGLSAEDIDTEIEELVSNGKIAHKAKMERLNLQADKNTFNNDKAKILQTRTNLLNKHTTDRQHIEQQKKEQEIAQFIKALDDKPDFMGIVIPKEFKDGVAQKLRGGFYDNEFSVAENRVSLVLQKELGPKFTKLLKESAFAKGKETEIVKNANIPIKQGVAPGQRVEEKNQEKESNQFNLIKEDFG